MGCFVTCKQKENQLLTCCVFQKVVDDGQSTKNGDYSVSHTPSLKPYRVELLFHILPPKETEEMRSKILTSYKHKHNDIFEGQTHTF